MKLRTFTVTAFHNILDSGEITVQEDVTCLVGKNEAGKSSALQALRRLNSWDDAEFDLLGDYPRWRKTSDTRELGDGINDVTPISAVFELDDGDREAVSEVFGPNVLVGETITYSRNYKNQIIRSAGFDQKAAIGNLIEGRELTKQSLAKLEAAERLATLGTAIDAVLATEGTSATEIERLNALSTDLQTILAGSHLTSRVHAILDQRLPVFFYFSDYQILEGRIDLERLDAEDDDLAQSSDQTARALLKLAQTDQSVISTDEYEVRKAELEAVSNDLTAEVSKYWKQNQELEVVIDIDKETKNLPNGQSAVARFLDIRVKDRRHNYTGNFGQRSSGFQWFFSFLAAFSEFGHANNADRPIVVLLDEPALGLHAKAQGDFMTFINERLAPFHQVLYTTHSPFMVENGSLERVRVVEDRGPEDGARVTDQALATDRDSLFPLQAALGYDIAQNLFIGENNLLVEGTSDFTYLTVMSERLKSLDREYLNENWTVLPTGGITKIPTFVALLGGHLDLTVLVDSSTGGQQKLTDLANSGQLDDKRIVSVGEVIGAKNADIEDVFSIEDFLAIFNGAFNKKVKAADLPEGDRIVKRIAALEGAEFDHGVPADHFLRKRDELLDGLSDESLDGFEKLIAQLNKTLKPG